MILELTMFLVEDLMQHPLLLTSVMCMRVILFQTNCVMLPKIHYFLYLLEPHQSKLMSLDR